MRKIVTKPVLLKIPCSKLQGIFDRKEVRHFQIRSLTTQPAKHCRRAEPAGNAFAFAVHDSGFPVLRMCVGKCKGGNPEIKQPRWLRRDPQDQGAGRTKSPDVSILDVEGARRAPGISGPRVVPPRDLSYPGNGPRPGACTWRAPRRS